MKIMFVPTGFPSDDNRSTMLFVYEQAKALAKAGHEITVLHVQRQPSKAILKKIDSSFQILDDGFCKRYFTRLKTFAMHRLPEFNRRIFSKKMKELFRYAWDNGERPDVLYAHFSCWAGCAAVEIGKEYHIPVVAIEHYGGFLKRGKLSRAYEKGLRNVVENAQAVLCVSNSLRRAVISISKTEKAIEVIPNMIDDIFTYHDIPDHDRYTFCTLCHLNKGKRVLLLVKAFCECFSAQDDVVLKIGGDGTERSTISEYVHSHKREHQIIFCGRLTREDSYELYLNADCFVLPSKSETFGIVYREAMAVGRPVITTDHGGWDHDEWSDAFGIKIPTDDLESLKSALLAMRKQSRKYDLKLISDYAVTRYGSKVVTAKINPVFERVVREYEK